MRNLALILSLFTMTACSSGGGGSNGPGIAPGSKYVPFNKVNAITETPEGTLKILAEKPVTSDDTQLFFKQCTTDQLKLDPRLRVGMSEKIALTSFRQDKPLVEATASYFVKSLDPANQKFTVAATITNTAGISPGNYNGEADCHTSPYGLKCVRKNSSESKTSDDDSCEIDSGESKTTIAKGQFDFKEGGVSVAVNQLKVQTTGKLFCGRKDTGKTATQKYTIVSSSELPNVSAFGYSGCDQTTIFIYQQIVDSTGVTVSSSKIEVISQDKF